MKLRVATCATLPEPDVDERPLADALAAGGFDARLLAWDDPAADWASPIPTILRSTWNYALDADGFLAWIDQVSSAGPLFNPRETVRANVHKRYLLELAARGVPVIPTMLVERGARCDLSAIRAERIVVKPEIGAGSLGTRLFARTDPAALAHVASLGVRTAVLVQPYIESVEDYGERAIVFIDGAITHAVRKAPRFTGDVEVVEGPFTVADDERAVAEAALAPHAGLLYGRVDVARDAGGRPMVMELELVEPSLFFARMPGTAERYAAGLRRRLTA